MRLRLRTLPVILLAIAACLSIHTQAVSQDAEESTQLPDANVGAESPPVNSQNSEEPAEIPEVIITTDDPVAEPTQQEKPNGAASVSSAQTVSTSTPTPPSDSAEIDATSTTSLESTLLPLPGMIVSEGNTFVPVTTTTAREFVGDGGATLADTLQLKPGISGSNFAPGANRPIIRGLDSYRVRIQENGIGTHDVSAISEDHAVPIDPLSAERVEVIRGPATLRYGGQAIGGVVSAINNRIPEVVPEGGISARVPGGFTSVDEGWDGAFDVTVGSGHFAFHADAFKRDANDYDTPRGREFNSFVEREGGAVGGSVVGSDGYIGVALTRLTSLYGIPGEEAEEERPRIDLTSNRVISKGELRPREHGIDAVRYWFGATDYDHNELVFEDGEEEVGQTFKNRQAEARLELDHSPVLTPHGVLTGSFGVQYNNRRVSGVAFEEGADSLIDPAARTEMVAAFLYEELKVSPDLRLMGSLRYENSNLEGTGLVLTSPNSAVEVSNAPTFNPFSASIGLLYDLPHDVTMRMTAHHSERAPADGELYSRGIHEATGTFEIGDPFLTTEKANTLELGFRRATGAFRFDTAAFYTRFDGFIFKGLTGIQCGDSLATCGQPGEDELDQVVFGQRDATFYGLELAAEHDIDRLWRGVWGVAGQFDFVRAEFTNGDNVPRQPPPRLGGGVYYRDAEWIARLNALQAFRQNFPGVNETPTPGYTLLNAELSYTTTHSGHGHVLPQATIGIRGSNLLNDEVRYSTSFKKDEILWPGASVRLFGIVKLN